MLFYLIFLASYYSFALLVEAVGLLIIGWISLHVLIRLFDIQFTASIPGLGRFDVDSTNLSGAIRGTVVGTVRNVYIVCSIAFIVMWMISKQYILDRFWHLGAADDANDAEQNCREDSDDVDADSEDDADVDADGGTEV
jgi:hypothetical protein